MIQLKNAKNKIKATKAYYLYNKYRKLIQLILIPLIFSPIPIAINSKPAYCAFLMIIMSFFWITECLPIPITSIMPVAFYPLFGITSSKCVSEIYFQDIQMLFWAALAVAIGIETSG